MCRGQPKVGTHVGEDVGAQGWGIAQWGHTWGGGGCWGTEVGDSPRGAHLGGERMWGHRGGGQPKGGMGRYGGQFKGAQVGLIP